MGNTHIFQNVAFCCLDIAGTSHNLDIGRKQYITTILNVLFLVFSYIRNMICAHVQCSSTVL